jgi:hypothetical protein
MNLFLAGGLPMVFVLLFGAAAVVAGFIHLVRPDPRREPTIRALSAALLAAIGAGTAASIAAVCVKVPANPEWAKSPDLPLILLTGLGESMADAILGFAFLAVTWMAVAAARRRLQA